MSSYGQQVRGGPPAWGLGKGLTTLHHKNSLLWNVIIQDLGI
jgi:hypothetical protein